METKKIYKIGDRIEEEEIMQVSRGIVKKALKIIEASSISKSKNKKNGYNVYVTRLLENKDIDTLQDLYQVVSMQLFKDNYIITKECYKDVNKYLYNYKKDKIQSVEIIINDDTNVTNVDFQSYVNYINKEEDILQKREIIKKFNLDMLDLTEKQKEILNIYSKIKSMSQTAELLGVAKSTVQVTIERIRKNAVAVCGAMEF